jgi:hypothetical protein
MCGAEQVVLVREDARLVLYTMTSLDFVLYLHNLHEWASIFEASHIYSKEDSPKSSNTVVSGKIY